MILGLLRLANPVLLSLPVLTRPANPVLLSLPVLRRPANPALLSLLALLSLANPSHPALFSLQDSARPALSISNGGPIAWWEGGPAFVLASAGAVRVNFRAVYTYPPRSILRDLNRTDWHGQRCNASAWALCLTDVGQAMPSSKPRMPENSQAVVADGWTDLACANSAGKILVSLGVYDISACDVFDEGLDLVYSQGMLYHRHNSLQTWEYWLLVALAVVLVRCLSHNLKRLWEPGAQDQHAQWPALLASFVALVVVLADGDSLHITTADQVFYWSTAIYILVYLAIHLACRLTPATQDEYPVYNVIVATLQFIASRFYTAAETPYNLVLIAILAVRAWSVFFWKNSW